MARMNRPAPVEVSYKHMRFLITHNPTNATLSAFIEDLKKYGATTVVRVCEVTYDKAPLEKDGITVVQWARPRWKRLLRVLLSETGPACPTAPSSVLPGTWAVCGTCQPSSHAATGDRIPCTSRPKTSQAATGTQDWPFDDGAPPPGKVVEDWLSLVKAKFCEAPGSCVAVHCVAGLGRAPVLVALALIESGMKYEDAIQFIRQKRRGAINSKQLTYLEKYRPKQRLRFKDPQTHKTRCCVM
nr:protein tyrosine phosphatase type IVA 3 isoform X1 [Saimiri boliviensis boliviensis]XP_039320745.1 protein tyrosine phosphatase type IVA 3 isoform X1 [Saimiri boliviensis boliviensis]XP_039320746.1 protein tyrosine phosphatase type IVA 3 isoform X1 [Saimiri boliviensis boliviensis]